VYPQHLKYGVLCLSVDNVLCLLQRQHHTL
jgi:hypothetical protein